MANYRDRKGIYIKKYKRKYLMWSRQNRGDFTPKTHGVVRISHKEKVLCEFRTTNQAEVRILHGSPSKCEFRTAAQASANFAPPAMQVRISHHQPMQVQISHHQSMQVQISHHVLFMRFWCEISSILPTPHEIFSFVFFLCKFLSYPCN